VADYPELHTAPQQPAAPSGEAVGDWVLVPRKPTRDMANAAWRELESQGIDPEDVEAPQIWHAMLAAAPQPPAAPSAPAGVDDALVAGAMEAAADACSRHVVCNEAITAAVEYALAQQPAAPTIAKHQPCGRVICTCEDEQQCQGCGAKHYGRQALSRLTDPQLHEIARVMEAAARKAQREAAAAQSRAALARRELKRRR